MANRSNWKGCERRAAVFFGTRRTPLSGTNSGHATGSDTLHERLYIECKTRRAIGMLDTMRETIKAAAAEGKVPLLWLHQTGKPGDFILCRPEDLTAIAREQRTTQLSAKR